MSLPYPWSPRLRCSLPTLLSSSHSDMNGMMSPWSKPFILFPILCVIYTIWTVLSLDSPTVSSFYTLYHSRTSPTPAYESCQKTTMAVVTSYPWPILLISIPFQIQWDNCAIKEVYQIRVFQLLVPFFLPFANTSSLVSQREAWEEKKKSEKANCYVSACLNLLSSIPNLIIKHSIQIGGVLWNCHI